MLSRTAGCWW